jgi:hypothetical protein
LLHLPDAPKLGVNVTLFFLIEDLLTVQIDLKPAIFTRGDRDRSVTTISPEKLVRHPRGGRVMLSRDAVDNIQQYFPFRSHFNSP